MDDFDERLARLADAWSDAFSVGLTQLAAWAEAFSGAISQLAVKFAHSAAALHEIVLGPIVEDFAVDRMGVARSDIRACTTKVVRLWNGRVLPVDTAALIDYYEQLTRAVTPRSLR
jgi:hypothetical protein